jgi:hypothetical protein
MYPVNSSTPVSTLYDSGDACGEPLTKRRKRDLRYERGQESRRIPEATEFVQYTPIIRKRHEWGQPFGYRNRGGWSDFFVFGGVNGAPIVFP